MYETPQLERFGSFRELTMVGNLGDSDGFPVMGATGPVSGSNVLPPGERCEETGMVCFPTGGGPGAGRS